MQATGCIRIEHGPQIALPVLLATAAPRRHHHHNCPSRLGTTSQHTLSCVYEWVGQPVLRDRIRIKAHLAASIRTSAYITGQPPAREYRAPRRRSLGTRHNVAGWERQPAMVGRSIATGWDTSGQIATSRHGGAELLGGGGWEQTERVRNTQDVKSGTIFNLFEHR